MYALHVCKGKHKKGKQSNWCLPLFVDLSPVNLSTKGPELLNKTSQFWKTDTDLFMHVFSST